MADQFIVHFWGVRGSIPCPGPDTVRYGGNTPCVAMRAGGEHLVFDGGTGLRMLGDHLRGRDDLRLTLFFSHIHWDHIQGFPFFVPAFTPGNRLRIYGPSVESAGIEQHLTEQMRHPNFPVPLVRMGAELSFRDVAGGDELAFGDVRVKAAALNHPGGALGYRVAWRGCTVTYISDTEHPGTGFDANVLELAAEADVCIYDATYTDEEYRQGHVGWGHSTWQEAVRVAQRARVKRLVLFHHDPSHSDAFLDEIGELAGGRFPNTDVAREGLTIQLSPGGSPA